MAVAYLYIPNHVNNLLCALSSLSLLRSQLTASRWLRQGIKQRMQGCMEVQAMHVTTWNRIILPATLAGDTILTVVGWVHEPPPMDTLGLQWSPPAYQ